MMFDEANSRRKNLLDIQYSKKII